jgi:nucleoside-diphosphate-sugar epimerase
MNVFVTGATGFLGFSLTRALAGGGHRVTGLARTDASRDRALRAGLGGAGVEVVVSPLETLAELPARTECVVHVAGLLSRPGLAWSGAMAANLGATVRLLRLASVAHASRFVIISSQSVYGSNGAPWSEDAPLNPLGPYATSKAAAEVTASAFADAFEVRIARLSRLYGASPFTRWDELSGRLARASADGTPMEVRGSGEQRLDLLHVDDAARGVAELAVHADLPAGIYNLGSGASASLNELVTLIAALAAERGLPAPRIVRRPDVSPGGPARLELDASKVARALGWRAQVSLRQGLGEMVDARRGSCGEKRVD